MIKNENESKICKRKVLKLQNRFEEVINDHEKKRRMKDMELAGISEMIKQLQDEIQMFCSLFQHWRYKNKCGTSVI